MNKEDIEYRQGKSKKQVKESEQILTVLFVCSLIGFLGYAAVRFAFSVIG